MLNEKQEDSIKHIAVPNRKFLAQLWISGISGIWIQNFKYGNSRFIFGTEIGPEVASLEWVGIRWYGKWLVLNTRDGKFPGKFGKKFGTKKTRRGMQTSATDRIFRQKKVSAEKMTFICSNEKQKINMSILWESSIRVLESPWSCVPLSLLLL